MLINSREEFIRAVTDGLSAPPQYFFKDAMINKSGYENIDSIMERNSKALNPEQVEAALKNGATLLDTRSKDDFCSGFIPGSLFIGLDGTFAVWVGTLVDINTPLVVLADAGREREAILRLARVGYENVAGYAEGGINAWKAAGKSMDTIASVSAEAFAADVNSGKSNRTVVDVRRPGEYGNGHVKDAEHVCLSKFAKAENLNSFKAEEPYYLHCQSGYRSVVAASILKNKGVKDVVNVEEGWAKIKTLDLPLEIPETV